MFSSTYYLLLLTLIACVKYCIPMAVELGSQRHHNEFGSRPNKFGIESRRGARVTGEKMRSDVHVDRIYNELSAISKGYRGRAKTGNTDVSGIVQPLINMTMDKMKGVNANVGLMSAKAKSGKVGIRAKVGASLDARFKNKGRGLKVGIEGPNAGISLGKKVRVDIGTGFGVDLTTDIRREIGARLDTPIGSFGFKAGCSSRVCLIACVTVKLCR